MAYMTFKKPHQGQIFGVFWKSDIDFPIVFHINHMPKVNGHDALVLSVQRWTLNFLSVGGTLGTWAYRSNR